MLVLCVCVCAHVHMCVPIPIHASALPPFPSEPQSHHSSSDKVLVECTEPFNFCFYLAPLSVFFPSLVLIDWATYAHVHTEYQNHFVHIKQRFFFFCSFPQVLCWVGFICYQLDPQTVSFFPLWVVEPITRGSQLSCERDIDPWPRSEMWNNLLKLTFPTPVDHEIIDKRWKEVRLWMGCCRLNGI